MAWSETGDNAIYQAHCSVYDSSGQNILQEGHEYLDSEERRPRFAFALREN